MDSKSPTKPIRSPDQPRFSFRQWCWIVGSVFVLGQVAYVLSWPFVIRMTETLNMTEQTEPQTGRRLAVCEVTWHPVAALAYLPLEYLTEEIEVPALSPLLRIYADFGNDLANTMRLRPLHVERISSDTIDAGPVTF